MKRILVTGSEGYIGSHMVPYLIKSGYQVVGLDSCFFSDGNLGGTATKTYPLIRKDVRRTSIECLKDVYAVVHLAGLSNDPLGMLDEHLTYEINYEATINLAILAKKAGVKRFIFSSSCSLYGAGGDAILNETSPQNPQSAYAKSKVLAERDLAPLNDDNFSITYMRNATAFGFSPRMRFDLVVNSLAGYAHTTNVIEILGDGKPWRPLVHICDISKAFLMVLRAEKKLIHDQAFNVGSSKENYQIKRIAEIVASTYPGSKISIAKVDAKDSRNYNVSFDKITNLLHFTADWSVDDGVAELAKWFNKVCLDKILFEQNLYSRLKQINFLLEAKIVDKNLFYANG